MQNIRIQFLIETFEWEFMNHKGKKRDKKPVGDTNPAKFRSC
jgi:hypothetical protein